MKTCDVCLRTDRDLECFVSSGINSLTIGTSIDIFPAAELLPSTPGGKVEIYKHSVEFELCTACIQEVNTSIAEHVQKTFGLTIRK